jgi:hypothetical protein
VSLRSAASGKPSLRSLEFVGRDANAMIGDGDFDRPLFRASNDFDRALRSRITHLVVDQVVQARTMCGRHSAKESYTKCERQRQ